MNKDAIRDKVAVVGAGCSKFGENWDKSPEDMIVEAAYEAYADAGIDDPQERIEAVFCGAQYPSKGTAEVADALKLYDRPVSMVVNYCATGTDAFRYGVFAVACGMYDTVLVVGFDKPKDRGVSGPSVAVTGVRGLPATPAGWFALCAARYFEKYGAGREDLARIAVKNHHNGTLAPKSMLKREITIEDALGARIISWPFGLYDCAAQSDGAAAAILTRRELASSFRDDYVLVRAIAIALGPDPQEDPSFDFLRWKPTISAAKQAYEQAGIANPRKEIHVA
ncbi:MAG: acetyl-CoA acetyltransferase, partial [Candidatus Binatia bacterium]